VFTTDAVSVFFIDLFYMR